MSIPWHVRMNMNLKWIEYLCVVCVCIKGTCNCLRLLYLEWLLLPEQSNISEIWSSAPIFLFSFTFILNSQTHLASAIVISQHSLLLYKKNALLFWLERCINEINILDSWSSLDLLYLYSPQPPAVSYLVILLLSEYSVLITFE